MTETFANLYVGPYIKSTKRQSSYLEIAIAAFTLELPQLLLKSLYVAAEYIPSRPTMSKMGHGELIAATSCHTSSGTRQKSLRKPATAHEIGGEPKPLIH
jgi:hypothetical protein